ncbi:Dip2/Utp12 family-domain-containing protein [Astrocystis sublimbata]|nr:Dip2/Utp12 family-domain-containing protein [Astrocystis sublimbata]
MSTKRKAPARIAHPVVKQSAKKPLKPQINESEAAVSVAGATEVDSAGDSEPIIEISSDPQSSEYELSDHESDHANDDEMRKDTETPAAPSSKVILAGRQSDNTSTDHPMTESNQANDADSDQELAQPTLGELARAHGETIYVAPALTTQSNAATTKGRASGILSTASMGNVLAQALRTDDSTILETCLSVTERTTIVNTIQRLDSTLAGILLTKLASRMHRRPGRAGMLMVWVQSTLISHGGALAAQPGLVKRLSELQRVLDERARGLNSLLALKGKLDLMNAQLNLRQRQSSADVDDNMQDDDGIIYVEGEDSDAGMINGVMDLDDDDELPITNGIGGSDSEDEDLQSDASEHGEELDVEEVLDEDEVDHEDVDSEEEDSEAEAAPEPPSKRSKSSRGR